MSDPAIEMLPPDTLRPWVKNARTHSKKQVRQIAESIKTFGFTNPVLIDAHRMILAGHGRVEAAKLVGMERVPCIRLDNMTAEQKQHTCWLTTSWRSTRAGTTRSLPKS